MLGSCWVASCSTDLSWFIQVWSVEFLASTLVPLRLENALSARWSHGIHGEVERDARLTLQQPFENIQKQSRKVKKWEMNGNELKIEITPFLKVFPANPLVIFAGSISRPLLTKLWASMSLIQTCYAFESSVSFRYSTNFHQLGTKLGQ